MLMEQAIVTAVNVQEYSVDVLTEDESRALLGVPIMNPVNHPDHTGGIIFLPEVGAKCWICTPGSSTSAFVLGFMWNSPTQEEVRPYEGDGPNFTGNRAALEPGDVMLGTVDGNAVIVRRGGLIQVGASPLCQRIYMPIGNVVKDYFQRYHGLSPLGEIEWGHARLLPEHGTDLSDVDLPVTVRYKIKTSLKDDVGDETKPFPVELRIGILPVGVDDDTANNAYAADLKSEKRHIFMNDEMRSQMGSALGGADEDYNSDTVLSLVFNSTDDSNTPGRQVSYAFQLSRTGDRYEFSGGHVLSESRGSHTIRAKKSIILEAPKVRVGGVEADTSESLVLGIQLRQFLADFLGQYLAHTHPTAVGPTGPALNGIDTVATKLTYIDEALPAVTAAILSDTAYTKK
jgi:hypothetical protein